VITGTPSDLALDPEVACSALLREQAVNRNEAGANNMEKYMNKRMG